MGLDMHIYDENDNEVAYWRKFNALHAWFVTNLQDGVDECQRSRRITKEDIEQIIYIFKVIDVALKMFPDLKKRYIFKNGTRHAILALN